MSVSKRFYKRVFRNLFIHEIKVHYNTSGCTEHSHLSLDFRLAEYVLLKDCFEAGHVPQVEEGQTDHAGGEEGVWLRHEQLYSDRVEPGHDHHP